MIWLNNRTLIALWLSTCTLEARANTLFFNDFTANEGFAAESELRSSPKWEAQDGFLVHKGKLRLLQNWARGKNTTNFRMFPGDQIVLTTIVTVTGAHSDGLPVLGIGLSDAKLHAGQAIPAVETIVCLHAKGISYGTVSDAKAWAPLTDNRNALVRLIATITKSTTAGVFYLYVELFDLNKQKVMSRASWSVTEQRSWNADQLNIGLRGANVIGTVEHVDIESINAELLSSNR